MALQATLLERTLDVLRQAHKLASRGPVSLATSLSAEDMVITDLIAAHGFNLGLFALDTGMLHAETLAMIDKIEARYGLSVAIVRPDATQIKHLIEANGAYGFYDSLDARMACCHVRKVAPLNIALKGHVGWITGQRRDGASSRADLGEVETDIPRGLQKFNPLAIWSWDDVVTYTKANNLPMNPLYDRGHLSIGCEPCTRALRPGEHPRAGRWWWENNDASKECGLHISELVQ
jgi:phosphoadenosine phosphosulfate reductase